MFKENFIRLCNKRGEKPTAVCIKLGISKSSYSYWNDISLPREATLQKIADYFGITVDELLSEDEPKMKSHPNREPSELEKEFIDLIRDIPEEQAKLLLNLLKSFRKEN